jgi:hypothetical protein
MRNLYLTCDETIPCGSVEHYYHFLWGYLLPTCHYLITRAEPALTATPPWRRWLARLGRQLRHHTGLDRRYVFRSCGPLMDPLIAETLSALGRRFSIIDKHLHSGYDGADKVFPARWDVWLHHVWFKLGDAANYPGTLLTQPEHFLQVRQHLLDVFLTDKSRRDTRTADAPYLILKRSAQHAFYERGGKAEIATYGTGRRTLHGLEAAQACLADHGIPCRIFEAGQHSLREQINAFHHCRGIIAMRGAEVANMIWMQPRSQVILHNPAVNMPTGSPARAFASYFDLDYTEIDVGDAMHPTLNAAELLARLHRE